MGTIKKRNRTTFVRCPKDEQHPFTRIPATLYSLNGYQLAIMAQILSNRDDWNIVKKEISKRLGFPREKFNNAWKSLIELGYIHVKRIQGGIDYTIYEDLKSTCTTGGICEGSTSTTGSSCAGGMLTTINKNNDYNTEESSDQPVNEPVQKTIKEIPDEKNSNLHQKFVELKKMYPSEVIRPDCRRYYLKSDLKRCEDIYSKYLNKGLLTHSKVLECLETELQVRNQNGTMQYIKTFVKWLSEGEFNAYKVKAYMPVNIPYSTELI
jgi:hypothetical protein